MLHTLNSALKRITSLHNLGKFVINHPSLKNKAYQQCFAGDTSKQKSTFFSLMISISASNCYDNIVIFKYLSFAMCNRVNEVSMCFRENVFRVLSSSGKKDFTIK